MTRTELLAIAKPILFNTPMVQAILGGYKTATRRLIKPKNAKSELVIHMGVLVNKEAITDWKHRFTTPKLPYKVGDILYVRETWCSLHPLEDDMCTPAGEPQYYYAADGYNPTPFNCFPDDDGFCGDRDSPRWKPSIHMPKEAARIFLHVTAVNVEHLQDITEEQAKAEGFTNDVMRIDGSSACKKFSTLWNSTTPKADLDCYGWNANPWVGAYEFERIEVE